MPFSNYTELKQSIVNWSKRKDIDLLVPDFIALAEDEMYNPPSGREPLKLKQLEKTSTATTNTTDRFIATPDDFASIRNSRIDVVNESDFFEYRSPEQLKRYDDTGRPCFFTVIGTQIEFDRVPDEELTIEIQYFSKDDALTEASPTNLVLTNHPNVYLYGALHQLFLYSVDAEQAANYQAKFNGAILGANKADKDGRFGPSPVMKVRGSTP